MRISRKGFTLVELLVVIGIIALLIAILIPALIHGKEQALRAACASKLHNIMIAAEIHRQEHKDYYPLVGVVNGLLPTELDDPYMVKYDYDSNRLISLTGNGGAPKEYPTMLASITESLAISMSYRNQLTGTNTQAVQLMYDPSSYIQNFLCPAQAANFRDIQIITSANVSLLFYALAENGGTYAQPQSYIYNEYIMGYYDPYQRLRGKATLIRQPASTFFAADGLSGAPGNEVGDPGSGLATYTLFNIALKPPVTMADAYVTLKTSNSAIAADGNCFDRKRHQKLMNVAFCDGHVDCIRMCGTDPKKPSAELQRVFIWAP